MCENVAADLSALKLACNACSKWFLDKTGHVGLNNLLAAYEDKSAYAQCIFAFSQGPGHKPILFDGRCPVRAAAIRAKRN